MKGMIFTNFLEVVEELFGFDTVDAIIESCDLPSGGAYTSVGTYDHTEMVALLQALEKEVGVPIPQLLAIFGEKLFGRLAEGHPMLMSSCPSSRDLFHRLDGYIHVEVAKLYPDAELPRFRTSDQPDGTLLMHYLSDRHLEELAGGLINGCLRHFGETATVERWVGEDETVVFAIRYPSS